jgi:hypothetical protein
VLKNPGTNLSLEDQKILSANAQACAPYLGERILKNIPNIDKSHLIKTLSEKFVNITDFLAICSNRFFFTDCERLFN